MPLIETKGALSAQGFGEFAKTTAPVYIEDVMSVWLYTGNGSTQTITNGIDLSTYGGLVWTKARSSALSNYLCDTVRGRAYYLYSNATVAQQGPSASNRDITTFNANGYSLGPDANAEINTNAVTFASWTFRKQPKFFDVVTYTGTGANRTVAHSLGSVPGCIIVKRTDTAGTAWVVYHTSLGNTKYLTLQTTNGETTASNIWNNTSPTSTVFTVGTNNAVNANGGTYVAYLFAHDAGGFGLTGTDNVITCGSFTTDGSGNATVSLGYEPQWVLMKSTATGAYDNDWYLIDSMRGPQQAPSSSDPYGLQNRLSPNTSGAESGAGSGYFTSTGFYYTNQSFSNTYIYIAIRRGPMKTPTTGTSVYNAIARTGTGATATVSGVGFSPDMVLAMRRDSHPGQYNVDADRLRGPVNWLGVNSTEPEYNNSNMFSSFTMDGFVVGSEGSVNNSSSGIINWAFRRAPGFFDVVCYTGTGSSSTSFSHNLGVAPELIISKTRSGSTSNWIVTSNFTSTNYLLTALNLTIAGDTFLYTAGASISAQPTSTTLKFTGGVPAVNDSGATYVAYLFATVSGVSKVGSYTGTGTTKQIDCGFTGGARFVLIKRTDSTGDWYVWDSARGIVSGNDPYLLLNSTAAEVTNTDYVDTYSAGFEISSTAPAAINANGGSFIFLAIA